MGRVLFTAKAEPAKAEPKINWSEIESRLQEISKPTRPSDLPAAAFLPLEPSAPLANDPAFADEQAVTSEPPITGHLSITSDSRVMNSGDSLDDMLSLLAAVRSNRS